MKHPHAELAQLYAADMMNSKTPWKNWEVKTYPSQWVTLITHPSWDEGTEYRRKLLTEKRIQEGWIEHTSDSCPVDKNSYPEVLLEDGQIMKGLTAKSYDWRKKAPTDIVKIVAYKPVKTPLSMDDIPLGSLIFDGSVRKPIVAAGLDGVLYYQKADTDIHFISYQDMMTQGWEINKFNQRDENGSPTTWNPCYK